MHFDINTHTIFRTITGSHAYGMATKDSDVDVRGVAIAPASTVLGFAYNFEQYEDPKEDTVIYDVRKFFKLATDNNPNIIELLFINKAYWQKHLPVWMMIYDRRQEFLHKGCVQKYTGYAFAQLKRIKTHRKWLLDPPKKKPLREEYGLPEHKKLTNSERGALNALMEEGYDPGKDIMTYLVNEKKYQAHLNHWKQYKHWKKTRNPARAELEAKYGYDTKHASHLVRLMEQCVEILTEGTLTVGRMDLATTCVDVRAGLWPYEKIMEYAEQKEVECQELYETSTLRKKPNKKALNDLCVEVQQEFWSTY